MKTEVKIAFALAGVIGVTFTTVILIKKANTDKPGIKGEKELNGEDSFSGMVRSVASKSIARQYPYIRSKRLADLIRWGTKEGIIEVADLSDIKRLATRLEIMKNSREIINGLPSHLKQIDSLQRDLLRYGTKHGLMVVSNDSDRQQRSQEQLANISRQGKQMAKKYLKAKARELNQAGKKVTSEAEVVKHLKDEIEVTQFTISNNGNKPRAIGLFQANKGAAVSPPLAEDVHDHTVTNRYSDVSALHPQGMAVNPYNQFVYVCNQLSSVLTILDKEGNLFKQVSLSENTYPGAVGATDVAINTDPDSLLYGYAYVSGTVTDTLYVIDTNFKLVNQIDTGRRPLAVAFNPFNNLIFVTNYKEGTVSVINAATYQHSTLNTLGRHYGMAVNTQTGDTFITSISHNVIIKVTKELVISSVALPDVTGFSNIVYHPSNRKFYLSVPQQDHIISFDPETLVVGEPVAVGHYPCRLLYNSHNNYLYVANIGSNDVTVLDSNHEVVDTVDINNISFGLAINEKTGVIYTSDSTNSLVYTIGYLEQSSTVVVDEDIAEKAREYQQAPITVKSARFILSGSDTFNILRLRRTNASGSEEVKTISLQDYASPRSRQNMAEVDLEGIVIDGKSGWEFEANPNQTITLLISYKQNDMHYFLPESSPPAEGVEMSKGVAKAFTDKASKFNPLQ